MFPALNFTFKAQEKRSIPRSMTNYLKRTFFLDRRTMPDADSDISRPRLIRDGTFLEEDRRQIAQRRRGHNQLRVGYG